MAETRTPPKIRFAQISLADDITSPLPLEHTSVSAQITGPLASVLVTQRFGNPLGEPAELDYLFPLPSEAAVTGFEIQIGSRRVLGDLQEAEAARKTYDSARGAGQRSALLEQRRPNLFALRLANVQPGEKIAASLRYQERVRFDDDSYEFVFPMGITPRYDAAGHPEEGRGVHAPLAAKNEQIGPVEIQVSVDAGSALTAEPASPSHPLRVSRLDERRFQAQLDGSHIPDRDFVLRYAAAGAQAAAAAWTSRNRQQETFLACVLPPRLDDDPQPAPREFVFVLDRSGSMVGEPIAQARNALRACLRALGPQDAFRILLFDNQLEWFRPEPSTVTQAELDAADAYLAAVDGRGGTEIIQAIEAALTASALPGRMRYIVFLTDGAVSAEDRAIEQVRGLIGGARLFTFGIGPSVNRALLSRMAQIGRGRAAFLQLDEDIEGAIIRFQDSVSYPMVTDLQLRWENAKAWDIYPAQLPDLYAGEVLALNGRLTRQEGWPARLVLTGRRDGQVVELPIALPEPAGNDPAIERMWAQAHLMNLLDQMDVTPGAAGRLRDEIIGLALAHNLVTPYTSFVAVDQEQAGEGVPARVVHVSVPLPKGLSAQPFQGGLPPLAARGVPPPAPTTRKAGLMSMARSLLKEKPDEGRGYPTSFLPASSQHHADMQMLPPDLQAPVRGTIKNRDDGLRWLARSQNLDGSWNGDYEMTAVALLAFLRAGHTPRSGTFRALMRRGIQWIRDTQPEGLNAFLRVRVLEAHAAHSGDAQDLASAQQARASLAEPSTLLEQAAAGMPVSPPQRLQTLDDLRLAALVQAGEHAVPAELLSGPQPELAQAWAVLNMP